MTNVDVPARTEFSTRNTITNHIGQPALSFAQERIWFTEQLAPGTAAYVIHGSLRLHGALDVGLLRSALDTVADRHDSLRMRFTETDGGEPRVEVLDRVNVPVELVSATDAAHAEELVAASVLTPFDLATAPLLRVLLVRLSPEDHVLHVDMHHIVSDGWSLNLLLAELATVYGALRDSHPLPAAPPVGYTDYAAWQRERIDGPAAERDLTYWTEALADVPPLELPTDRPRPPVQSYAGATHRFRIDAELTAGLRVLGRSQRATLYMTLLSGWQAVLFRHSGQRDFAVGSPVAGRVVPELESLVGLFVNTVVLRADLSASPVTGSGATTSAAGPAPAVTGPTTSTAGPVATTSTAGPASPVAEPGFATLLRRTRNTVVRALGRQELPFERLVKELNVTRDVSRPPVFQVLFALQNYARTVGQWPQGLTGEGFGTDAAAARFDLSLYVSETQDDLRATLVYNTDLFDADTVRQLSDRYVTLLRAAVADPDRPVVDLPLLTDEQTAGIIDAGTGEAAVDPTGSPVRLVDTLAELAAGYAHTTPDAPAVVDGDDRLSYADLDRRANQLAHWLRGRGVGPESLVGVCLEQSVELAVTLLGVLRAGGAYLPLDPEQPPARTALMLADARPVLVLTSTGLLDSFTPGAGPADPAAVGQEPPRSTGATGPADQAAGYEVTPVERVRDEIAACPVTPPPPTASGENLAYVIYTSGSTGVPKGVAVAHRQVLRYLTGVAARFEVTAGGRYALLQSLSFDFSVTIFHLALATGGVVHLLPRRGTGAELAEQLDRHRIDYLKITPSHLTALAAETGPARLLPRRALILGGEPSDLEWAGELAASGPARIFNHYGPTEATVGVTTSEVRPGDRAPGPVPTGRPLPYARVYLLDSELRPVPAGVPGEIWLGGDRLARGYLNRPGLTAERFVPDPYGPPGARIYRTGDLGRWRADGQLVFLGRRDHQVKIRGYRVELGEVEAALRECPGVRQAAVLLRDERLVAYLERSTPAQHAETAVGSDAETAVGSDAETAVGSDAAPGEPGPTPAGTDPEPGELRRSLAERLPEHMVPSRFVWLDRLPLQDHGKIDRRALPEPVDERPAGGYVEPDGPVEQLIATIWQAVLKLPQVGATDDFFELGGHSLLATQVVARLRRELPGLDDTGGMLDNTGGTPVTVTVMDLFRHRTVRTLAAGLALAGSAPARLLHELTPPAPASRTTTATLVCVPYGGGSAVVYQPLADALPAGYRLFSVSMPGHDIGLADEPAPIEEVAAGVVAEILERVDGPLILYGHCGPGGALAVEVARRLEAAGRELTAVYLGAVFPFGRPVGGLLGPLMRLRLAERIRSDRIYRTWLQAQGTSVGQLDPAEVAFLIRAMRHDARVSEDYFTELLRQRVAMLRAPVISVVGDSDRSTDFHTERFREWHFLARRTALAVIDEGGHYFLKYRAGELAEIVTTVHERLDEPAGAAGPDPAWRLAAVSDQRVEAAPEQWADTVPDRPTGATADRSADADRDRRAGAASDRRAGDLPLGRRPDRAGPQPSMARFAVVASGQIITTTGSALTNFAIPLWIYVETGSLARFALFAIVGLLPGLLCAPLAGALIDRSSRRRVLLLASLAAGSANAAMAALLLTERAEAWHLYLLVGWLSVALAFQRLAFVSAIPQLVPKPYLGHANGLAQTATGLAQFLVPLIAVALLEAIGLGGILVIDVLTYVFAVGVLLVVRFPRTLALQRREGIGAEILNGLRYSLNRREFRAMLAFFAALNLFLFPVLFLLSPLVLGFAELAEVARVALVGGVGAAVGGLVMLVWGGPRHRRMRAVLVGTLGIAVAAAITGLRPSLPLIAAGAFGMYLTLALVNGVYNTIIQTKVPPRFHGRVFALNQMVAWSTLPLGWGVIAPLATRAVEPLMMPDGALAPTVGAVLGVGPGRGIGLLYVIFGLCIALTALISLRTRVLARFDDEVPDAPPDDVIGLEIRQSRAVAAGNDRGER